HPGARAEVWTGHRDGGPLSDQQRAGALDALPDVRRGHKEQQKSGQEM
ncbi:uncharacterized protein METZ01_LOCUS229116, partial [marine metagenome]